MSKTSLKEIRTEGSNTIISTNASGILEETPKNTLKDDLELTPDDIEDATSIKKFTNQGDIDKLGNITITNPIDLDNLGASTTNLSYNNGTVESSTGTDAVIPDATNSLKGLATSVQITKLENLEDGAEVNQTSAEIVSEINTELGSTDWQQGSIELTTPNKLSDNPELLVNKGALSFCEDEENEVFLYEGFEPLNSPEITSVYEPSNGFGDYVIDIKGNGVDTNPTLRIKLGTESGVNYNLDTRIRFISGTGRIATLDGVNPDYIEVLTNTEWGTFSSNMQDDGSPNGIIISVQGFQETTHIQLKMSIKKI